MHFGLVAFGDWNAHSWNTTATCRLFFKLVEEVSGTKSYQCKPFMDDIKFARCNMRVLMSAMSFTIGGGIRLIYDVIKLQVDRSSYGDV